MNTGMDDTVKKFLNFCDDPDDPFNQMVQEIGAEISRDQWLGACAVMQLIDKPITEIATEPLEALAEMIRAELLDRDVVAAEVNQNPLPF